MRRLRHPFLPGLVLALTGLAHPWLQATMARHMLAELPLLFIAGWLAAHAVGADRKVQRCWSAYRPAMLLAAMLGVSVWMLPVALDDAVIHPAGAALKVAVMLGSGFLAGAAWRGAARARCCRGSTW